MSSRPQRKKRNPSKAEDYVSLEDDSPPLAPEMPEDEYVDDGSPETSEDEYVDDGSPEMPEDEYVDDGAKTRKKLSKTRKKLSKQRSSKKVSIDLSDVPSLPPILKNENPFKDNTRKRPIKEGASAYMGVYFSKLHNQWRAQIQIEGRVVMIGNYDDEEQAAIDYARAAFKYKANKSDTVYGGLDLKGIPDQPFIRNEKCKSGFKGVKANKKRWEARISINGQLQTLGTFDTVEEAASIHAKADYYLRNESSIQAQSSTVQPNDGSSEISASANTEVVII